MKWIKISQTDLWVLLFIRQPFMVLMSYVLLGRSYFNNFDVFLQATLLSHLITVVVGYLQLYLQRIINPWLISFKRAFVRFLYGAIIHIALESVCIALLFLLANAVHFFGYTFSWGSLLSGLLVGVCINLAITAFYEGIYSFSNWKRTIIEAEELKRLTLKNRLAGLRNQTDPHFFFNSINTLSELIDLDEEKAERFLDEMCIVYRYLLMNVQDAFVPLKDELNFIRSWSFIVQTRYGSALKFDIEANEAPSHTFISRLSLLGFLEAVLDKYIFEKDDNVCISIKIQDENVVITHPILKIKNTQSNRTAEQIEEIRNMNLLLRLPDIVEQEANHSRTIFIPIHYSENTP